MYKRPSLGVAVRQKVNETISVARRLLGTGEYTVEFMGLYDMIILLCGLKVEESVIFGNGPNRVDRPEGGGGFHDEIVVNRSPTHI